MWVLDKMEWGGEEGKWCRGREKNRGREGGEKEKGMVYVRYVVSPRSKVDVNVRNCADKKCYRTYSEIEIARKTAELAESRHDTSM